MRLWAVATALCPNPLIEAEVCTQSLPRLVGVLIRLSRIPLMRIVLMLAFLVLGGPFAAAQSTPPQPVRYDLRVKVIPNENLLDVSGTMTLPSSAASRNFIQL